MKLYKLKITYPTPDGRAFRHQPPEDYEAALEAFLNNGDEKDVPEWLQSVNLDGWVWVDGEYGDCPGEYSGTIIVTPNMGNLSVPIPGRITYLRRRPAEEAAERMRSWGCDVQILVSKPIEWDGTL